MPNLPSARRRFIALTAKHRQLNYRQIFARSNTLTLHSVFACLCSPFNVHSVTHLFVTNLDRKSKWRCQAYGVSFGFSVGIMFFANAAAFRLGGYLVQRNEVQFEDMFKYVYRFICIGILYPCLLNCVRLLFTLNH